MEAIENKQRALLEFRKDQLLREIHNSLELLQGSLRKSPSQTGYHLNSKLGQKTKSKYVRKHLVPQVRAMTRNHLKVRQLLRLLSDVNWRLLQLSLLED